MSKKGLGPVLSEVIFMSGDECCHLGKFIGHGHNGIVGLFILYGAWELDDQVHCDGLEWKGKTID